MEQRIVEKNIKKVRYHHLGDRTTIAIATLNSGFEITGSSATVDPTNYDTKIGEEWAYKDVVDKLEILEAFYEHEHNYRVPKNRMM